MIALAGQLGTNLCTQGFGALQPRAATADDMETRVLSVDDERRVLSVDDERRSFE